MDMAVHVCNPGTPVIPELQSWRQKFKFVLNYTASFREPGLYEILSQTNKKGPGMEVYIYNPLPQEVEPRTS